MLALAKDEAESCLVDLRTTNPSRQLTKSNPLQRWPTKNMMPKRLPRSRQREHSASFPTVESTSTSSSTSINLPHEYQRGSHSS
ncbi:hypothetical protein EYC80_004981 [Monilinia laxa]|uniref:Uncharacterized protein n=1 Tax=Monilinia laxa TaxID=61186 RepID=A0A5N6KIQ3_MONLA|nr:hypothetical protein EYC80_004981 [Monilinia laxa]